MHAEIRSKLIFDLHNAIMYIASIFPRFDVAGEIFRYFSELIPPRIRRLLYDKRRDVYGRLMGCGAFVS